MLVSITRGFRWLTNSSKWDRTLAFICSADSAVAMIALLHRFADRYGRLFLMVSGPHVLNKGRSLKEGSRKPNGRSGAGDLSCAAKPRSLIELAARLAEARSL